MEKTKMAKTAIDFKMGKDSDAATLAKKPAEPEGEPTEVDAMQTFIDAVKAGDADSAHRAMQAYKTLCEYEEPEVEMETFSG
jgi:deoxyribose-phosphate aldolase